MNDILIRQLNNLQKQVDALVKPEVGRWVDWTPTVTQSGSVTVTIVYARYYTLGKLAVVQARLLVTGTGTAGNAIAIGGQPTAIQASNTGNTQNVIGVLSVFDQSAGLNYSGPLSAVSGTDWRSVPHGLAGGIGVTPSFGLANPDRIGLDAIFEVA